MELHALRSHLVSAAKVRITFLQTTHIVLTSTSTVINFACLRKTAMHEGYEVIIIREYPPRFLLPPIAL